MTSPLLTQVVSLLAQSEIYRNREFYRTQDVRPPFTYASLIRQVRKEPAAFSVSLMQKPPMQCYPPIFQSSLSFYRP